MTGPDLFDALSMGVNVSNVGMPEKTTKTSGKDSQFSELMSKSSGTIDIKTNVNDGHYDMSSTSTIKEYRYDTNSKIKESTTNPLKEKIDSSAEKIDSFEKKIVETVSEDLGVESEDVEEAMEILGLSVYDLLNPQNLADLTARIKGISDSASLILDADFQMILSDVTSVGQDFMNELDITQDEMTELVAMMELVDNDAGIDTNIDILSFEELQDDGSLTKVNDAENKNADLQNVLENNSDISLSAEGTESDSEGNLSDNLEENAEKSENDEIETFDKLNRKTKSSDSSGVQRENLFNSFEHTIDVSSDMTSKVQNLSSIDTYLSADTMDIIEQIVQNTKVVVNSEVTTMEMQLNPENLGKVYLNISSKEGSVNAQLTVTNDAVKEALEAQIITLRENLNQAGVKVDAVEVTVASHEFERNLEQDHSREEQEGGRQEENSNRRRNINLSSLDELAGVMTEEETLVAQMMKDNGNSVDLTA